MAASSARSKADNIFEKLLSNGDSINLTKTAVLYGANASGKSNVLRALGRLRELIVKADKIKIDEPIRAYSPFLFNTEGAKQATEIEIIFIIPSGAKYRYAIAFDADEIQKEELFYYHSSKPRNVFTRITDDNEKDKNIHTGRLGKELNYKKYDIHKKLPLLSLFGRADNYHADISPIYSYFQAMGIWDTSSPDHVEKLSQSIIKELQQSKNNWLKLKLESLISACDTQIDALEIDSNTPLHSFTMDTVYKSRRLQNDIVFAQHKKFKNQIEIGVHNLPFKEESLGTNRLLAIGGLMIKCLEKGGVLIFDELDSSLHPNISRFLMGLFLNPITNPHNAQLIFTSHEPNLMDKDSLRADQIWFAEKNQFGETELFSAQDFDKVREDIPFDKWYLAGKFGAIPRINNSQFSFSDEEK